jgi:hypothetical protein
MKNLIVFILLALFFGCKGDQGPAAPVLSGSLMGFVYLYGTDSERLIPEDVIVSIEGTASSDLTKQDGSWIIENIPAGIYDIRFYKPGFYMAKNYNVQFTGGGTLVVNSAALFAIPEVTINQFSVHMESDTINFKGTVSAPSSRHKNLLVMFSKEALIPQNEISYDYQLIHNIYSSEVFDIKLVISPFEKLKHNLNSGDKLYAAAIVFPYIYSWGNYNPVTKKYELFTEGITLSNIDSLIIP